MASLRTLVIAENLPYPTLKGGDLRAWQNVSGLMNVSEVGVFGLCSNDMRRAKIPRPGLAFWRSSTDPALAFPPPENRKLPSRAWYLDAKGHPADVYYSDAAAAEIDHILADFDPHIVVMERLWLYRYIDCLKRTNCRIVLDSYNIEASVYRQIANSIAGDDLRAKLMRDALPRRTEVIEKQAVEAVDQLWVCSDEDEQIMRSLYEPSAPICVIPNGLDLDSYDGVQKKSDTGPQGASPTRKSIIFTAMFGYPPNVRAANFLIGELFPRLLAGDSSCQLLLVGAMPTSQMCAAAEKDRRIIVTGAVADVRPYIAAASVMVVPLTEGGGTRYKILEAFAARVPVVSTAVGAQGLKVKDGEHLLIAERVGDFATAIEQIVTDARLANRLTERAFELIKERYSWEFTTRSIERAIAALGVTR